MEVLSLCKFKVENESCEEGREMRSIILGERTWDKRNLGMEVYLQAECIPRSAAWNNAGSGDEGKVSTKDTELIL